MIMLHKGSRDLTHGGLEQIKTPEPTRTHLPIPHHVLLAETEKAITDADYEISDHRLLVSKEGQKFLGSMTVTSPLWDYVSDYVFKVAVMSSHDRTLPIKFFTGTEVFVCTNGCWSAELMLSRKHTHGAWGDIHNNLGTLVLQLNELRTKTVESFEALKEFDFDSRKEVHDFIIESSKCKILPWQHQPHVLEHWNNPEHPEFTDRNGYVLFNAYTSFWRKGNPMTLAHKTQELRKLFDTFKGVEKKVDILEVL